MTRKKATVVVDKNASSPEFIEGLTDFTYKEGETIILTVK